MKKEHGGKTYVTVPAQVDGSCQGCAAQHDGGLCDKLHTNENGVYTTHICLLVGKIFKEQTMSEQKEKTALELVDEIIACPGCPSIKHLTCLKSAIERERDAMMADIQRLQVAIGQNQAEFDRTIQDMNDRLKSAITMRPISELPGKAPDGCAVFAFNDIGGWLFSKDANPQKISPLNGTTFTHFYTLPLPPAPERKLHKCYMPGCEGEAKIEKTFTGRQYVYCEQCGAHGPVCATMQEAKDAWGYE